MFTFLLKHKTRMGILLIILSIAYFSYQKWGKAAPPLKWKLGKIEMGNVYVTVTATGIVQAVVSVEIGTQVSGTVSAIYADYNSIVKKGQVIARIDTTLLKASLTDALASQEKADAQGRQATDALKRSQTLFDRTLISQSDLDVAIANARVAVANVSSARAQVDRARINLKYATIISPINGIVLSRAVDVGQTVAASFNTPTLFTIAGDLKQMQVQASIDEADIGKIKLGQKATFVVDAYPDSNFIGQVKQIRLQPVTVQNVVSYNVIFSVDNSNLKLMPGMTANLTITVDGKENVLVTPASALRFVMPDWEKNKKTEWKKNATEGNHKDSGHLFILENGTPKFTRVKEGLTDGSRTEIVVDIDTGIETSAETDIKAGVEVVTGIDAPTTAKPQAAAPFGMSKAPGGSGGGGRYH